MQSLVDAVLHEGITVYKKCGSKASLPVRVAAEKQDKLSRKGVIFAVRDKAHFMPQGVKGYVVTSKESLLEDVHGLTHFTPNVYRYGAYADVERRFIKGFTEENLQQINTFVVDIDTKKHTVQDILLACLENSIGAPTFIIESTRGYQVYFVLETPLFISNKNEFRGLKVAKRISQNLKRSLSDVQADLYCNDFGFFRMPTPENIVWQQLETVYSVAQMISWSEKYDDGERPLFVVQKNAPQEIMRSDWFYALITASDVKGERGQIGRNNALFTLALICFQEGWDEERTYDFLEEYNDRLRYPLELTDLKAVLRSAYSSRYQGASAEYVTALLDLYVPNHTFKVTLKKGWYKFKKERSERTRSHYSEWEQDILNYITVQTQSDEPFIWHTQKQMCEAVNISSSTLNELLKKSTKLLVTKKGKGRGTKTGWTTVALYLAYIKKQAKHLAKQKAEVSISLQVFIAKLPALEEGVAYEIFMQQLQITIDNLLSKSLGNSG